MEKEEVRALLPEKSKELFDDIVLSRALGANRQIKLIGQMLTDVAEEKCDCTAAMLKKVSLVAQYFKDTRGQNSRAIYNAINVMLKPCSNLKEVDQQEAASVLIQSIKNYDCLADKNTARLIDYAVHLCEGMTAIMIFDYSSTVNQFVETLNPMKIYIPESRALNGGAPFVQSAVNAHHEVHFIPDTTMMHCLKECQAVFIGAETIYPDGTVFNTIGSDLIAAACKVLQKPLYVLTPLIKMDVRPVYGYKRLSPMPYDYQNRLADNWEDCLREKVDFNGIKLISLEPNMITAIVSEAGIIPTCSIFETIMNYHRELENENEKKS